MAPVIRSLFVTQAILFALAGLIGGAAIQSVIDYRIIQARNSELSRIVMEAAPRCLSEISTN